MRWRAGVLVTLLLLLFSFAGFGQEFGGSWSAQMHLLPDIGFHSTSLTVDYSFAGWTFSSTGEFFEDGLWAWQSFNATGRIGPFELDSTVLFGPIAAAFLYTSNRAKFTAFGVDFTLHTAMIGPNIPGYVFTGGPSAGAVVQLERRFGEVVFTAITGLGARLQDFSLVYTGAGMHTLIFPIDPFPGGLCFTYQEFSVTGLSFCPVRVFDISLRFSAVQGFDYLKISAQNIITLFDVIEIDAVATYRTESKELVLSPRWEGMNACFTIFGDIGFVNNTINAFELHGIKLGYEYAERAEIEMLAAFDVAAVEAIIGDIFQGDEYSYLSLSVLRPGCCPETTDALGVTAFFQETGSLFGFSRVLMHANISLGEHLAFNIEVEAPAVGTPRVTLGWTVSFSTRRAQ